MDGDILHPPKMIRGKAYRGEAQGAPQWGYRAVKQSKALSCYGVPKDLVFEHQKSRPLPLKAENKGKGWLAYGSGSVD